MTMMEFAGRLANHIAAHAVGMGCEIDSYAVVRDMAGTFVVRVTRLELRGLRAARQAYSVAQIAQMADVSWLFDREAERIVSLLLAGEGELT